MEFAFRWHFTLQLYLLGSAECMHFINTSSYLPSMLSHASWWGLQQNNPLQEQFSTRWGPTKGTSLQLWGSLRLSCLTRRYDNWNTTIHIHTYIALLFEKLLEYPSSWTGYFYKIATCVVYYWLALLDTTARILQGVLMQKYRTRASRVCHSFRKPSIKICQNFRKYVCTLL